MVATLLLPPDHQASAPACAGCRARDQRIAELEAELQKLRLRAGCNSTNSSVPPSANPLDAPKPLPKKPTGRKKGGQPGHPRHVRERVPIEQVDRVVPFVPTTCQQCQAPLPAQPGPSDPEPRWHQTFELPPKLVSVTEYQAHARTCPCCTRLNWAELPSDLTTYSTGPRLTAVISYLSGCHHVGKRGIVEIVRTLFVAPISLGMVAKLEQQVSAALVPAYNEAAQEVRQAPVKNVDETGWKLAGVPCWLWVAATHLVALFVIHAKRSRLALTALLGDAIHGILITDRWKVYACLPLAQRQICWAHLKRDFQKCVDRGGTESEKLGRHGLETVHNLFEVWHLFRGGGMERPTLQARLAPIIEALHHMLVAGANCADVVLTRFCNNLLAIEPALWTFALVEGVEPTNNHAERVLRRGVLWRKNAFGCQSEKGCRFVERILTVVQTLRLQHRSPIDYLESAIRAHRHAQPGPKLIEKQP